MIEILTNFFDCDWEPNEEYVKKLCESCLLPLIENSFRTGSLLDIFKHYELYKSYVQLVWVLCKSSSLSILLIELDPHYRPQQIDPIHHLLKKLNELADIYVNCLSSQKPEDREKDKKNYEFIKLLRVAYEEVNDKVSLLNKGKEDEFYRDVLQLPIAEQYQKLLTNLRFDSMDMKDENGTYKHHYAKGYSSNIKSEKLTRIAQEMADLSNALPIDHTNAIFFRVDKERVDMMKGLVMGAAGTPYAHGAYEFDIFCNNAYPKEAPKMNLTTTGKGQVRFNPNLYSCGKVCLSLLGTWRGNTATENWDPKISTILQVLLSTQAIIMSEEVYFNEPGFESERDTPEGERKNEAYANIVRYCNIKYAMIDHIKNPPKGFETVVKRHFYIKRKEIMEEVNHWIKLADENAASYAGLVNDHNHNWASQFKAAGTYKSMLTTAAKELEELLNKLDPPSVADLESNEHKRKKEKKEVKDIWEGKEKLEEIDVEYDEEIKTSKD